MKNLRKILKDNAIAFLKNRTYYYLFIDIILIAILIWIFKSDIISDRSMSICLLGTYIILKWISNAIYMRLHPFKCGLQLCV